MKMHIEYDDFGEYVEKLEDLMEDPVSGKGKGKGKAMRPLPTLKVSVIWGILRNG